MKSLATWVDLEDGHEYHTGDLFPHDGREIEPDRIEALSTDGNGTGHPVISVEQDPKEKPRKNTK